MKKVEDDTGDSFWIHETIEDGSPLVVCVGDEESDAEKLISAFVQQLPVIWSKLFSTMKAGFNDYGHSEEFPPAEFFVDVSRMSSDSYMGDKSRLHLRFEFPAEKLSGRLTIYDFFLSDGFKIVHHQPVF